MIRSMTGFGKALVDDASGRAEVEVRSVNHRYLKLNMKLPSALSHLESAIEGRVRHHVQRGAVSLTVRYQSAEAISGWRINDAVVERYAREVGHLFERAGSSRPEPHVLIPLALTLPGSVASEEETLAESAQAAVMAGVEEALSALVEARNAEGAHLRQVFADHLASVRSLVSRIADRAPAVPKEHRDRLIERVNRLLGDLESKSTVDESALLRELCLLSDRLDVTEEIRRLEGHILRFESMLETSDDGVGRQLDFLLQEFNREANTVGSKANDSELSHAAVELKVEIERMREQVQNLE